MQTMLTDQEVDTFMGSEPLYINDAEAHLRELAHRHEAWAQLAHAESRDADRDYHVCMSIRYHKEAEALYKPAPVVPKQLRVRWWETRIGVAIAWAVVYLAVIAAIFYVLNHVAGVK
jgi:hypothetical protein